MSTPGHVSDEALVRRARDGDLDAFETLVARYERRVYNLALHWLGSPDDAADVAQEAFVRVYGSLPSFRGDASFSTWLHRIAVNLCRDELRRRRRRPVAPLEPDEGDDGPARPLPDAAPGPETRAEQAELRALVQSALAALPDDFRQAVVLRDLHELGYDEIARVLGVAVGTVKSRIHRGRRLLRQALAAREPQEFADVRDRRQGGSAEP